MTGTCRLNNKSMRNIRRDQVYQCMAIDLAMLGIITKEECEMLIGSGIPHNLFLPNGESGKLINEKPAKKIEEPEAVKDPEDTEDPEEEAEAVKDPEDTEDPEEEADDDERGAESDN